MDLSGLAPALAVSEISETQTRCSCRQQTDSREGGEA